MPTYPVQNRITGEQKEVFMSINEWDEWKIQTQIGLGFTLQTTHQAQVKPVNGKTNWSIKTQDGNKFWTMLKKYQDRILRIFINGKNSKDQNQKRRTIHAVGFSQTPPLLWGINGSD